MADPMKFLPKKPHFFKPIMPGFKNRLKIPISFFKYLNGNKQEQAVLRRAGKKWLVKVNGRSMEEEGWEKFAEEHDLHLGDMLVFRHEGDMEFEVNIFDSSQCERQYELPQQEVNEETGHTCKTFSSQEKPKPNIKSSQKAFPCVEAAKDMPHGHSYFICTIKPYCLSRYHLYLPKQFALVNGLCNRQCTITIIDERRSWTCWLGTSGTNACIGRGWNEFSVANCLKERDRIMFEIVSKGEKPILKFHDLRGNPSFQTEGNKNNVDAEIISSKGITDLKIKASETANVHASTSTDANPQFISTIKPYSIRHSVLYLPLAFAKSNGLMNRSCEMILMNERCTSWSVWVGPMGGHFAIQNGWPEFREANGVQVGDTYKFELINNGTKPIARFYCKYSGKDAKQY